MAKEETKFTKKVRDKLKANGFFTHKVTERFKSGFPDLIMMKNGKVLFAEVKIDDNQPTDLQLYTLKTSSR